MYILFDVIFLLILLFKSWLFCN